jgi:hypothetical protein
MAVASTFISYGWIVVVMVLAGGTLGVAVIGSVFLSLYARRIDSSLFAHLPAAAHTAARNSVAAAAQTVARAPAPLQHPLLTGFNSSFMSGLHTASAVAAGVCILDALGALALPGRRGMAISTAAARVAGSTGADLDIVPGPKPA